jgi:subtilisin-like proprotein convertase family protein
MTTIIKRLSLVFFIFTLFHQITFAQDYKIFQDVELSFTNSNDLFINPQSFRAISLDHNIYAQKTSNIPHEADTKAKNSPVILTFPLPNGTEEEFRIIEYSMMESGLAAAFPDIKTYLGVGVKNPLHTIRFDYTSHGLRAVLRLETEMVYIDPVDKSNSGNYISYYRKDLTNEDAHICQVADGLIEEHNQSLEEVSAKSNECGFRKYTLAVAATSEYSAYYNATSSADEALVLSAITTSINRVNEIFERDLGVRLVLVDNMEGIFYYDAGSDPYTNNNPVAMLNENQNNITSVIGDANYDIGHVVSTSSGGVASVNSPCRVGFKARGVTGLTQPEGDVFDIDFLSHEIGHQFGAMHTFNNSCNSNVNWDTAVETGSGSTIMGYAGTCIPNVQQSSDAYFHAVSLSQMKAFVNGSTGSSCSTIIASANNQPEADAGNDFIIPISTPFYLEGVGSDADGDALTFCWEQMDNDSSAQNPISSTSTVGPTFRSYLPTTDSIRYFPNLMDLSSTDPIVWEILPAVSRDLNFRLTVRDNSTSSAGCFSYDDMTVSVDATAGPFEVSVPNNSGITWTEGDRETVTWDVANTDISPINCSKVDILLSYDGGKNFPTTLVTNVDNDGSVRVTIPEGITTEGRIMVRSVGNVFFDISDNNFTIAAGSSDFSLSIQNPEYNVCGGDDVIYNITVGSISGFSELILLSVSDAPAGVSASFSSNPLTAGGIAQLTISGTSNPANADYTMTLNGASLASGTSSSPKSIDFLMYLGTKPGNAIQTNPTNNEVDIVLRPTFTWNAATNSTGYELQVSTDPSFSVVNQSEETSSTTFTFTLTNDLESSTDYFWRVRGLADCGAGDWSIPLRFTTLYCTTYVEQDINLDINDGGDAYFDLAIPDTGLVASIEVLDIQGTHTWVEDISASLISPSATEVELWSNLCGSKNDFSLSLKDNAVNILGNVSCDPLGGGEDYQPEVALSTFISEPTEGDWMLKLNDNWGGDPIVGTLQSWSLKVCIEGHIAADPTEDEIALPLELSSFNVRAKTKTILLDWQVLYEKEIFGYEIERREMGILTFQQVGFVELNNNQADQKTYNFEDEFVEKGIVYQYRLRMLDYSGEISYSEIREAKISKGGITMNVYPNPARDILTIGLWGEENENIEIEIINIAGKRLAIYNLELGNNLIDISEFPNGIYIIKTVKLESLIQQKLVISR